MGKDSNYYINKNAKVKKTLEKLKETLPTVAVDMIKFKAEQGVALSTQVSYCYDLGVFFRYYINRKDNDLNDVKEINCEVLDSITKEQFLEFKKYLEFNDEGEYHNSSGKGIARRFSTLKNLYRYHLAEGNIHNNPLAMIFINRNYGRKDHTIIRLTPEEVQKLLKAVAKNTTFKRGRQRTYKNMTKQRDLAMFVLFLNTGLRISELVGLDLTDVDLKECSVSIVRKGGFADKVFFNNGIRDILKAYIKGERKNIIENKISKGETQEAFFLSIQGKRWSIESIENTVRQYVMRVIPYKHITPHKLRATYGSILYSQTGDIRLVSEVLGHENINTTIQYYAAMDDGRKKQAAKAVYLGIDKKRTEKVPMVKSTLTTHNKQLQCV